MSTAKGSCNCGKITVSISKDKFPEASVLCHCSNCSASGGSVFSVNIILPLADIIIEGQPKTYHDTDTVKTPVNRYFCADCGSPCYTIRDTSDNIAFLKGGLFRKTGVKLPTPVAQYWTSKFETWEKAYDGTTCVETQ